MMLLKIFLLFFSVLKCINASAYTVLTTTNSLIRAVVLIFPASADINLMLQYYVSHDLSSVTSIENFLRWYMVNFPGSSYVLSSRPEREMTDEELRIILAQANPISNRIPRDLDEWKRSLTDDNNYIKLPINIKRSSIITDSVQAYKDLDRIPYIIPRHLFNRNIKVTYIDEAGDDYGGLRNEFFTLFFNEIIRNSGLFAFNSEGFMVLTPERTSQEDLDTYEAFGFYLAKAFQNNALVGCHFADIIVEMIKFGQLKFNSLTSLESWDSQLASSLKIIENLPSNELKYYDFNDLDPGYPSYTVTSLNVSIFTIIKFRNEIVHNFQVQLLMITLGFVRACPGHLLSKSNVNLAEAFMGRINLTADELISAFVFVGPFPEFSERLFSKWLRSLNSEQLMMFFRFLTGLRVIPLGDLSNLNLKIVFSAPGTEHKLPQSNTCLRILTLPPYTDEEQAMVRFATLLQQIESGDAFGFGFA